jgi:23S rRNA (uracil1939-C5)-methyltransferase
MSILLHGITKRTRPFHLFISDHGGFIPVPSEEHLSRSENHSVFRFAPVEKVLARIDSPDITRSMIVTIHKSAFGGHSIAFVEKKAVFIPETIPGERVEIDEIVNKGDYATAKVTHIIEESPDRIASGCISSDRCGGCDYLHMNYSRELAEKREIIVDSLTRIGKFSESEIPEIETVHGERFHYRSHASVKHANFKKGFYGKDSHEVAPFPQTGCLLLDKHLFNMIMRCQSKAPELKAALDRSGTPHVVDLDIKRTIEEETNGVMYRRDIGSFFQANRFLRGTMVERVTAFASPQKTDTILELGCGCGFFTLHLAPLCGQIHALDIARDAIAYAIENAQRNSITNAQFSMRSDESIDRSRDKADIIVADPPRAGLSKRTRESIAAINPARFVYVSCNPSTWSRDARDLVDAGFAMTKITFIDMFPATQHIEIVSLFERK